MGNCRLLRSRVKPSGGPGVQSLRGAVLATAALLAACGSGGEDLAADGEVTGAEVAAAMENAVQPRPGQYRTAIELMEFDIPGLPPEARQQMQAMAGAQMSQTREFCLTPEEAAENGAQQMAKNMAEGNCTFSRFVVDDGKLDADMQCQGDEGATSKITMAGTMTPESSDITMELDQEMPGRGQVHMKMRATSERVGDCA